MAFFLLFVYLRSMFKRSSVQSKWPRLWGRNSNNGTQTSSPTLADNPGQLSSPEGLRSPNTPPFFPNSQLHSIEIGFLPALTPDHPPNHVTVSSTETESSTISSRGESRVPRPLPAVTRTFSGRRGSPLHRRSSSSSGRILPNSNVDEGHGGTDTNSEPYLHPLHFNDVELFPTAWPSPTLPPPHPNSEAPNVGISNIEFPETPISVASIPDEEVSMETTGRYRPTRDTMYTEQSVMTLPVYKENEDERMSIASRVPTYRSTIIPQESMPPLPVPPSFYVPTVVSNVT